MRLPSLLVLLVLLYLRLTFGASPVESAAEIVWNVIGIISLLRSGSNVNGQMKDHAEHGFVLSDANFLFSTFYREDDDTVLASTNDEGKQRSKPTMAPGIHDNLQRVLDILEIEHRLHRLRQATSLPADQRVIIEEAINESTLATSTVGEDAVGGVWLPGYNMADREDSTSAELEDGCSSDAEGSIQRSRRQIDDDLEPYVPYLGFIFYSFPIFSFTLPFGGQLKLFGYDFI